MHSNCSKSLHKMYRLSFALILCLIKRKRQGTRSINSRDRWNRWPEAINRWTRTYCSIPLILEFNTGDSCQVYVKMLDNEDIVATSAPDISLVKQEILQKFRFGEASRVQKTNRGDTDAGSITENKDAPRKTSNKDKLFTNNSRSPRQVIRNERERGRKARLNAGFKVLRKMIPLRSECAKKDKLTQVQVLKMAARYIYNLTVMLEVNDDASEVSYSQQTFYDNFCEPSISYFTTSTQSYTATHERHGLLCQLYGMS